MSSEGIKIQFKTNLFGECRTDFYTADDEDGKKIITLDINEAGKFLLNKLISSEIKSGKFYDKIKSHKYSMSLTIKDVDEIQKSIMNEPIDEIARHVKEMFKKKEVTIILFADFKESSV